MKWHVLISSVSLCLAQPSRVGAQCYSGDNASGQPWPGGTTSIKVFVHYDTQASGVAQGLPYALNLAIADTEHAVRRTLHIMNEEVGGKIKLQYAGVTTSTSNINNAIVLRAAECSNDASLAPNAFAFSQAVGTGQNRIRGEIRFFRNHSNACNPVTWFLQEGPQTDFPSILIHELGHVFYDVGHPNDPAANCGIGALDVSIMRVSTSHPPRPRVIKDWDRELFQYRHGVRAVTSSLYRSYRNAANTWQTANQVTDSSGVRFMYRPGSLPQNVNERNIGFLRHPTTSNTPQLGGGGTIASARYNVGGFAQQKLGEDAAIIRPVAVAATPGNTEILVVYVKRANGLWVTDSDIGMICYRRSFNTGVTYAAEECETSQPWRVYRNGLTAAYSSFGNVFLVGYVGDGDNIRVGLVPATGSATPAHFSSVLSFNKSWHAPAVACRTASVNNACRVVWEAQTNTGCRTSAVATINAAAASVTIGAPAYLPCLALYDTPGLAHNNSNDTFEMAYTWQNESIFAYSMPNNSLVWNYDGSVWNAANSFVLSAALSYRSTMAKVQAYFVKFN